MAEFTRMMLTDAGKELAASTLLGNTISVTKIVLTDSQYSADEIENLTDIEVKRQIQDVVSVERQSENTIKVKGVFQNKEIAEGYYIHAVGLYAKNYEDVEVLYGIALETTHNCYISSYNGTVPSELTLKIFVAVGNSENVAINISGNSYVSEEDFLNYKHSVDVHMENQDNPHNVTKTQVGLGNVPNVATDDQTPTFEEAESRENIESSETLSTLLGKIKKWFTDLKSGAFASVANNCTTTEEGHVLDARQGRMLQGQVDEINSNISELGKSVADGKSAIASAITNKGVSTASDATFDVMAANIKNIKTISEAELSVKYYDSHTASSGGSQISNNKSCDLSSYKNVLGSAVGTVWSDNERSVTITDKKGHVKLFNLKNESGNIKFALNDLSGLNYNVSGTLNSSNGNFSFINLPPDCKVSCTAKSSSGSSTKTATVTLIVF